MIGSAVGSVLGNPLSVTIASLSQLAHAFDWRRKRTVASFVWRSLPANVHVPPLNWHRWFEVPRCCIAPADCADCADERRRQRDAELHCADRERCAGNHRPGSAALLFHAGIGGSLGNLLSVRLIRRIGATSVAQQVQRNISGHVVPLAVSRELDRRRSTSRSSCRAWERRFSSRAAGAARRCRTAPGSSDDSRDELFDDLSRRLHRRGHRGASAWTRVSRASCRGWGSCSWSRRSGAACWASAR